MTAKTILRTTQHITSYTLGPRDHEDQSRGLKKWSSTNFSLALKWPHLHEDVMSYTERLRWTGLRKGHSHISIQNQTTKYLTNHTCSVKTQSIKNCVDAKSWILNWRHQCLEKLEDVMDHHLLDVKTQLTHQNEAGQKLNSWNCLKTQSWRPVKVHLTWRRSPICPKPHQTATHVPSRRVQSIKFFWRKVEAKSWILN